MGCCSFIEDTIGDLWDGATDFVGSVWDDFEEVSKVLLRETFRVLGITGETIYVINVSTQRLIPDKQPDSLKRIILDHALVNSSIAANLQQNQLVGVSANILKYLRYGQDTYIHDIPTGGLWYHSINRAQVDIVLDSIEGVGTSLDTLKIQLISITEWIKWYLQEHTAYLYYDSSLLTGGYTYNYYGYTIDIFGNYIIDFTRYEPRTSTTYMETTTFTVDNVMRVEVREHTKITVDSSGAIISDIYSPGYTVTTFEADGTPDSVVDVILLEHKYTTIIPYDIGFTVPVADLTHVYFIAEYYLDSVPTKNKIWVYDRNDPAEPNYPILDDLIGGGLDTTLMLPIIPLRADFININVNTTTLEYITSKQILKIVGLDMDQYIDAINENPDIDLIEDAAILFAISIYTDSQSGIKALYNLFEAIEEFQDVDEFEYINFPEGSNSPVNVYKIEEQRINTALQFNYIVIENKTGTVTDVNNFISFTTVLPNSPKVPGTTDEYTEEVTEEYGDEPQSILTIQYQDTATTYIELRVHGLILTTAVFTTVDVAKVKLILIETIDGIDRDNFVIPLSYAQMYNFSMIEEEEVIYEALSLTVYSSDSLYLEYYETSHFAFFVQGIIIVISVVLFILSLPAGGQAGTAFYTLAKQLLIQYALTLLLGEILKHNLSDTERAIVLAAYAYLSYSNAKGDSSIYKLSFAEDILLAVNAVIDVILIDQSMQAEGLKDEMDELKNLMMERDEELRLAEEGFIDDINRFDIVQTLVIDTYENPTDFYTRTVHTGNPGVISLDQIGNYFDEALKLPELT